MAMIVGSAAYADIYVPGYTKADGTYVQGYYKTAPNKTTLDNYSTQGNVNPYTGKKGTVDSYALPSNTYTPPPVQPVQQVKPYEPYKPYEYKSPKY